jgi:hypothetical protein
MPDTLESAAKTAGNLKTILGIGVGLVVGAFVTGFVLKEKYEDLSKSYEAILALQKNEWGPETGSTQRAYQINGHTICPNGSYMVGLNVQGGSNATIQAECRQLNLK